MKTRNGKILAFVAICALALGSCSFFVGGEPPAVKGDFSLEIPPTALWLRSVGPAGAAEAAKSLGSRAFAGVSKVAVVVRDMDGGQVDSWTVDGLNGANAGFGYVVSTPTEKRSLPIGSYRVELQVFNAAVSETEPVVWGEQVFAIFAGRSVSVTVPCVPKAPLSAVEGSPVSIDSIGPSPWADELSPGAELWYEVLPTSAYTTVFAQPASGSTALPRLGVFNVEGSFIGTATGTASDPVASLGFNSVPGKAYYIGMIDLGADSGNRALEFGYGPGAEPADQIADFDVTIGSRLYAGVIDNELNTINVFGVPDGADLSSVTVTKLSAPLGAAVVDGENAQIRSGKAGMDFSAAGNVLPLSVLPYGSAKATRTYWVRIAPLTSARTNQALAQISLKSGLSMIENMGISGPSGANFDGALAQFKMAMSLDPKNSEAVMWASLLDLASIVVDPKMRTLANEYFGIKSYPSTINELVRVFGSGTGYVGAMPVISGWSYQARTEYSDGPFFKKVPTDFGDRYELDPAGDYVYAINSMMGMPPIDVPEKYRDIFDGDPDVIRIDEYLLSLADSVIMRNPEGFNVLFDDLTDNLLAARLDKLASQLKTIPESAAISISFLPMSLTIGKAELESIIAMAESMKATLYLGKSISFNAPLAAYWELLDPATGSRAIEDGDISLLVDALLSVGMPFASPHNFLFGRPEAQEILTEAKDAYLSGIGHLRSSIAGIMARDTARFTLSPLSKINDFDTAIWPVLEPQFKVADIALEKIELSLNATEPTLFVMPIPQGSMSPQDWMAHYSDPANWPSAEDWGSLGDQTTPGTPPQAIAINMAGFFEQPLLALDSLFEMDAITGEPKLYKVNLAKDEGGAFTGVTRSETATTALSQAEAAEANVMYAVKVKDLSLGDTLVVGQAGFDMLKQILEAQVSSMYGATAAASVVGQLVAYDPDQDSISVWLPIIAPHLAYNCGNAAGETLTLPAEYWSQFDPAAVGGASYTTKGSFWFGLPDIKLLVPGMPMAPAQ